MRVSRRGVLQTIGAGIGALALSAGKFSSPGDPAGKDALDTHGVAGRPSVLTISRGATTTMVANTDLGRFESRGVRAAVRCVHCGRRLVRWRGIPLRSLVDSVGATRSEQVLLTSLTEAGEKRTTLLGAAQVQATTTVLAVEAEEGLEAGHRHPARLMTQGRSFPLRNASLISIEVLV